jgi:hypothetical protein
MELAGGEQSEEGGEILPEPVRMFLRQTPNVIERGVLPLRR